MNLMREGSSMNANIEVGVEKGKSLVVCDIYRIEPEDLGSEINDSLFSSCTVIGIAEILNCYEKSKNVYIQQVYVHENIFRILALLKKKMRESHRIVSLTDVNKHLCMELLMSCDVNDSGIIYALVSQTTSNYNVQYQEMEMLAREISFFEDLKKVLLKKDYRQVYRCLYVYEDLI